MACEGTASVGSRTERPGRHGPGSGSYRSVSGSMAAGVAGDVGVIERHRLFCQLVLEL